MRPQNVGYVRMASDYGRDVAGEGEESVDVDHVESSNVAPEPGRHARRHLVELSPLWKVYPLDPRGMRREVVAGEPDPRSPVVGRDRRH